MLLTKMLAQTVHVYKNWTVTFFLSMVLKSDCPEKFLTNTSIERKGNCPETCYRILVSSF